MQRIARAGLDLNLAASSSMGSVEVPMASRSVSYATIWCASVPWPANEMTTTSSRVEFASVRSRFERIASSVASASVRRRASISEKVSWKRAWSASASRTAPVSSGTPGSWCLLMPTKSALNAICGSAVYALLPSVERGRVALESQISRRRPAPCMTASVTDSAQGVKFRKLLLYVIINDSH
jgi:hypothetical protein